MQFTSNGTDYRISFAYTDVPRCPDAKGKAAEAEAKAAAKSFKTPQPITRRKTTAILYMKLKEDSELQKAGEWFFVMKASVTNYYKTPQRKEEARRYALRSLMHHAADHLRPLMWQAYEGRKTVQS